MARRPSKKSKSVIVHKDEKIAHWAFMDHIRRGLLANAKIKPGERLIIKDAVDGFFGEDGPTGHLIATDGGCFGNNFGLSRIIVYSPWFTYKEGFIAKIFADSEYWEDVMVQVPAAMDIVTNLYGIKFDYHCPKNLFEARIVDNPAMKSLLAKDNNEKDNFWTGFASKLWKRPDELYVGIRFAIAYTQDFRIRHKDTPEEELELAKKECRILLKQLAGWKGMRHLIKEQGLQLLKLIETELQENTKLNKAAAAKIEELERNAYDLVNKKHEIYKEVFDQAMMKTDAGGLSRAELAEKEDEDIYNFTPSAMSRIQEIEEEITRIRNEIRPQVHEKGLTDGKIADLSCKSAIIRYAIEFFAE